MIITEDPGIADFFLIPHNYFYIKDRTDYIKCFSDLADQYKKKILLFAYGDSSEQIDIPHTVIIRTSQYRSQMRPDEIIMPGYNADLLSGPLQLRKRGINPWSDSAGGPILLACAQS